MYKRQCTHGLAARRFSVWSLLRLAVCPSWLSKLAADYDETISKTVGEHRFSQFLNDWLSKFANVLAVICTSLSAVLQVIEQLRK